MYAMIKHNSAIIAKEYNDFLLKRTKRICSVIFMLTYRMSYIEPIRHTLRKSSSKLLVNISEIVMGNVPKVKLKNAIVDIKSRILLISSALEVCYTSGMISELNFKLILAEIDRFSSFLAGIDTSATHSFDETDFQKIFDDKKEEHIYENFQKKIINFIKNKNDADGTGASLAQDNSKGQMSYRNAKMSDRARMFNSKNTPNMKVTKESISALRRAKIMTVLEVMGVAAIHDFVNRISEYSNKTIQRELIRMVDEKILVREGLKRWTRYRRSSYVR